MAKKTTKAKALESTAIPSLDPMVKTMIDEIRLAFHTKYTRHLNLTENEIHALFEGDEFNDDEKFTKLINAESDKLRAQMNADTTGDTGGITRRELVDIANRDAELQSITGKFTEATDYPARAPAAMAWRLLRDYTPAQRKAFAVFGSDQKSKKDIRGNDIGDNQAKGYRWDKYHAKAVTGETIEGSWYQDFADDTTTGKALVATREALNPNELHEGKDAVAITIDGVVMDVLKMDKDQRKNFHQMITARRNRLAKAIGQAMACLTKIDEINDRLDTKRDQSGKVTKVGTVHAGFAMLDAMNPDKGISPSKTPIRLAYIYQDDVKDPVAGGVLYNKGMVSTNVRDISMSELLNLDIDKAFTAAGTARGVDALPNINEVVSSKYVKKDTTPPGEKAPDATATETQTVLPTAKATIQFIHGIRLQSENSGYVKALEELMTPGQLPSDQLVQFCYDIVEMETLFDTLITAEVRKIHDKVKNDARIAADRERDAKLAKLNTNG